MEDTHVLGSKIVRFLYKERMSVECGSENCEDYRKMGSIPEVGLSSGKRAMPVIGMGTAVYPFTGSETMKLAILDAIQIGYKHFDTAALYQSEQPLGEAIAEALQLGLINSRDELFITSKLWCCDAYGDRVRPALEKTLNNLGLEYLDLYLIHWPVSMKPGEYKFPSDKGDMMPMDFKSTWAAMEECQRVGLTRSIGVSNFSCKKLTQLLSTAEIPPSVNQVEMHPLWQQKKLREFCARKGIHVSAYSPLGGKGTPWGTGQVMDCTVLKDIAQARGKTVAQVSLRWVYEQGVSMLVKSFNKERLNENLRIWDWSLSKEELHLIGQIPQRRGFPALMFVSDGGPFKTVESLWDGEI
ncbi:non-functional NADPH-dependent codeinone reductase 2-like [Magnolia sinica]|uniref:non-functional NADPH-dependent codeinone reductase 2-like n=1 Tax=Magnolia sinica TaxID=86752 RepID=UPI002657C3D8|nr:non-functional NADPH-dependent codeinone reductase 2-like [Magnolia sinica]